MNSATVHDTQFRDIPSYVAGARNLRQKQKIPFNLFQTFRQRRVTQRMFSAAETWYLGNPEYDYFFFDDRTILDYLDDFDFKQIDVSRDEFLEAFYLVAGAGKADLFRYLVVFDRGGVYFDIDTICKTRLAQFIEPADEVLTGLGGRGDFHQWGLIYTRNHPFLKSALEFSVRNILDRTFIGDCTNLEGLCGPPCLDYAIRKILELPSSFKFSPGLGSVRGVRFRIIDGDHFGGNVEFKYEGYEEDLGVLNVPYWTQSPIWNDERSKTRKS